MRLFGFLLQRVSRLGGLGVLPAFLSAPLFGQTPVLGPKDGHGLAPTDTGRISVGAIAPDFTLEALSGPSVTLSQFHGRKNVVLVFYRGHW
jgi:cytochrome oxidase Cu insertion factor (SCO1/SenC/PrrC family)